MLLLLDTIAPDSLKLDHTIVIYFSLYLVLWKFWSHNQQQ